MVAVTMSARSWSKTAALSVLQASQGRDPEGEGWLSRCLPGLWSDRTEASGLR
jgi:hypothetical protein